MTQPAAIQSTHPVTCHSQSKHSHSNIVPNIPYFVIIPLLASIILLTQPASATTSIASSAVNNISTLTPLRTSIESNDIIAPRGWDTTILIFVTN